MLYSVVRSAMFCVYYYISANIQNLRRGGGSVAHMHMERRPPALYFPTTPPRRPVIGWNIITRVVIGWFVMF